MTKPRKKLPRTLMRKVPRGKVRMFLYTHHPTLKRSTAPSAPPRPTRRRSFNGTPLPRKTPPWRVERYYTTQGKGVVQ
jgi:hypothetical protein